MRYGFQFLCVCALGVLPLVGCFNDILNLPDGPCSGVDCNDGNVCTRDHCVNLLDIFGTGESGPTCRHEPVFEGKSCTFAGVFGVCQDGVCGAETLCDGVVCEDDDPCTDDTCAWNGMCVFTPVNCSDGNSCTEDSCDPANGTCDHAPEPDGTSCLYWFSRGTCQDSTCITT
jgi:hypothetical protein